MEKYKFILSQQRSFFNTGATRPITFRHKQLKLLKHLLQTHEVEITEALRLDLNKAAEESILTEILLVNKEIDYAIKNLKKWVKPKKVFTPLFLQPGNSTIRPDPYGVVLIIGPWNYPFMLILSPLIGAMSAGNCIIIKPSEIAAHTHRLILNLVQKYFPPEYICALSVSSDQMPNLLMEKFDYIFFTGNSTTGKLIMSAAAKHLTPVTLELGGKNPCIIDETANLEFAARRIVWAKFLNAGQTCVAPDHVYVKRHCKEYFLKKLVTTIQQFYSDYPEESKSYGRIINLKHFKRLIQLMQQGNIVYGGNTNENKLFISPTLIDHPTPTDPIMQEEIFGPLLPILIFDDFQQLIDKIKSYPSPLAAYLFTRNKVNENYFLANLSSGGSSINDCITHLVNYHLPFGGVGKSGINHYHGKFSFETFSHQKSIFKKTFLIHTGLEYPPYSQKKLKWARRLIRWL